MFYDTHAHYDDEAFDQDRDILLPELHRQGITLINDIGCDIPSSKKAISIAEQYPFVYAVVGAWPGNTGDMTEANLEIYGQLAQHPKVVAIGEIGLDYHYDDVPRDIQQHWFDRQMDLADRSGKPWWFTSGRPTATAWKSSGNGRIKSPAYSIASPAVRKWPRSWCGWAGILASPV